MTIIEFVCDIIPKNTKPEYCINGKDVIIPMEECTFSSADEFKDIFNKFSSILEGSITQYPKVVVFMVIETPTISFASHTVKTKVGFYASTDEEAFEGMERVDDSRCPKIIQESFNKLLFLTN